MLTGLRDTELLVMNELNDRDLLNYCQTDKYKICQNEDFWRNRFIKVHGEKAAQFKNLNRSWKDYYLAVIYYTDKYTNERATIETAKKEYMDLFLYFSQYVQEWIKTHAIIQSGNIKYLNLIKDQNILSRVLLNDGLQMAAKNGNQEAIDFFIKRGAIPDFKLYGILEGDNQKLIDEIINNDPGLNLNEALSSAIKGRNIKLIEYFIKRGANDFEKALETAVSIGDENLINLFIDKGAKNWNKALYAAIVNGNNKLIDFFLKKGARIDFRYAKNVAELGGYKDTISHVEHLVNNVT